MTQPPPSSPASAPPAPPFAGSRLRAVERLGDLRDQWTALACQGDSVFATWEFASIWWKHFGHGRQLRTAAVVGAEHEVIAIIPCYLWKRRPLRVVRFLGNGAGDILGPICRPDHRPHIAETVRRVLDRPLWDWDVFVAENLPGDEPWAGRLHGRALRREGNPVVRLHGDFDDYLRRRSANFRQQVRARDRRLRNRHAVHFRLADDADRLDDDLDTLFRLHRRRFGSRSALTDAHMAFHREFARVALEHGWLRLWILELDRRPVAAFHGFRYGGVEGFYQSGREPGFDRESLGTVMLTHAIRSAADEGVRTFALLRGHERYKYRFATEDHGLDTVCATRGPVAGAALGVLDTLKASAAARNLLRRRLDI